MLLTCLLRFLILAKQNMYWILSIVLSPILNRLFIMVLKSLSIKSRAIIIVMLLYISQLSKCYFKLFDKHLDICKYTCYCFFISFGFIDF